MGRSTTGMKKVELFLSDELIDELIGEELIEATEDAKENLRALVEDGVCIGIHSFDLVEEEKFLREELTHFNYVLKYFTGETL